MIVAFFSQSYKRNFIFYQNASEDFSMLLLTEAFQTSPNQLQKIT